jgi:hypothetical protein
MLTQQQLMPALLLLAVDLGGLLVQGAALGGVSLASRALGHSATLRLS